jgi:hypothetical protein
MNYTMPAALTNKHRADITECVLSFAEQSETQSATRIISYNQTFDLSKFSI